MTSTIFEPALTRPERQLDSRPAGSPDGPPDDLLDDPLLDPEFTRLLAGKPHEDPVTALTWWLTMESLRATTEVNTVLMRGEAAPRQRLGEALLFADLALDPTPAVEQQRHPTGLVVELRAVGRARPDARGLHRPDPALEHGPAARRRLGDGDPVRWGRADRRGRFTVRSLRRGGIAVAADRTWQTYRRAKYYISYYMK